MIDIYIINLKKRNDRLVKIKKEFSNYNLNIIEAIENESGWIGCFESHKKCIKIAKEKQLEYIIVIEDDCIKKQNFDKNLQIILDYLNKNMWDIFLGGVTKVWEYKNLITLNTDINLINILEGKTSHFVIYNSSSYDYFLNKEVNMPIDKCWHNNLNAITSIPFIAIQNSSYSDIEKKDVDYNSRFESVEKHFINKINNL